MTYWSHFLVHTLTQQLFTVYLSSKFETRQEHISFFVFQQFCIWIVTNFIPSKENIFQSRTPISVWNCTTHKYYMKLVCAPKAAIGSPCMVASLGLCAYLCHHRLSQGLWLCLWTLIVLSVWWLKVVKCLWEVVGAPAGPNHCRGLLYWPLHVFDVWGGRLGLLQCC